MIDTTNYLFAITMVKRVCPYQKAVPNHMTDDQIKEVVNWSIDQFGPCGVKYEFTPYKRVAPYSVGSLWIPAIATYYIDLTKKWAHIPCPISTRDTLSSTFYFSTRDDLLLFKLRWC